jgi:argininosuccinate lyase
MKQLVDQSYATTTELADTMVRECSIPFRTAHTIVGMVVKEALENGIEPTKIDLKMINRCSKKVLGRTLNISEESVRSALNPSTFIARRKVDGGPASQVMEKALADKEEFLEDMRALIKEKRLGIQRSYRKLSTMVLKYSKL